MHAIDRAVANLASQQGGAFGCDQAVQLGATRTLVRRRRESGAWLPAAPGVFLLPGSVDDVRRRRWVLLLSLGPAAVLSHESAGRLRSLAAVPAGIEVATVPWGGHRPRPGARIHQQRIDPKHVTRIGGLAATTVERTLCDLAMVVSVGRLEKIVDSARFDLGLSFVSMGETLLEVGTVGRPRAINLVHVLDARGPGADIASTKLEAMLSTVLELAGLPRGTAQGPLPSRRGRPGLVDRAFAEARLVVEADGRRWHAREAAMAEDRRRDLETAAAGWLTVRLMHEHLTGDPHGVADDLRHAYLARLAPAA
jgi:hypothetical protein